MAAMLPPTPLRVAIVGSGPSAFYTAEALQKALGEAVQTDLFDRLPVPFGLVRGGVAPDHQNIKAVTKVYDRIAAHPGFRFLGNVLLGRDLQVQDLAAHYHQIVYAFGCESGQRLGVPGDDLLSVHTATEFVGWYNGHPDHRHRRFDLAHAHRVAIVGNGNVAMDVARVLLADPEHLAGTDLADHALAALRASQVHEVTLLGRRGPAQAAFSPKEIEEIAELPDVDVVVDPAEAALDPLSAAWLERDGARSQQRNVKFLQERAAAGATGRKKQLRCRFLVAPEQLRGRAGSVDTVVVRRMRLAADEQGTPRPVPTDTEEPIAADLVFAAIGYKGVPVPGVPYEPKQGIVPNRDGRVLDRAGGTELPGQYAVGWCKRGPTGLIGTNSLDAKNTVAAMLADRDAGRLLAAHRPTIDELLAQRRIEVVTWADWQRLDAFEQAEGQARGKLRQKVIDPEAALAVVRRLRGATTAG
jgi:ferredoxin--NADP+ reductase